MEKISEESNEEILKTRFEVCVRSLKKIIENRFKTCEKSLKKTLERRLELRLEVCENCMEHWPEEMLTVEEMLEDVDIFEHKFEDKFQKTIRVFKKEFENMLEKMLEKHLIFKKVPKGKHTHRKKKKKYFD